MHVLITAGPTREYIDDVRFLSNASSGRMGYALAQAAQRHGWQVTLVTGPVSLTSGSGVVLRRVTSAIEMLDACLEALPHVDGVIAVAAVADYRPVSRFEGKLPRTLESLHLELVPNPDILAEIGRRKTHQWTVGFAVESDASLAGARRKLAAKNCDAIVLNLPQAMESADTKIQLLDHAGSLVFEFQGSKNLAAQKILDWIATELGSQNLPTP